MNLLISDRPEFERVYYWDHARRRSRLDLALTVGEKRELLVQQAKERLFPTVEPAPSGPEVHSRKGLMPVGYEARNRKPKAIPAVGLKYEDCY